MRLSFYWTVVSFIALHTVSASTLAAQESSEESAKLDVCKEQLDTCVRAAEAPESIDACSEAQARCIADAMEVSVPEGTSVGTLTQCAADATDCTLMIFTDTQFDSCATSLARCIEGVVETQLTCTERWTQCVQDQPLLFPVCALELLGCQDP